MPGVTLSTYLSTTDGERQLTVAQAIGEEQAAAPVPSSPAPVPPEPHSVPSEAAPVPPAGASVPKQEKQAPSWEREYPPLFSPEIKGKIARHSKTILICLGVAAAFSALFISLHNGAEPQYEYCRVYIEREDFERSSKAWVLVADDPSGAADCIPAQLAVRLEQGWEYVGPICNDGMNARWILLRRKK